MPASIPNAKSLKAIATALTRTGFITTVATFDETCFEGSPLLRELMTLNEFLDALRKENEKSVASGS